MEITEEQLEEARNVISEGGLVVFPTETAYGIAADATSSESVSKVYKAKDRSRNKGLTAIVSSLKQAEKYAELSKGERKIIEELMPGPLTLVAEKKDNVPDELNKSFAFRIPDSEIARKLAEDTPVTATSANISGEETCYSVEDISEELLEKIDMVLDIGRLEKSPTSTVAELDGNDVLIHREGPIKKRDITKLV